MVKVYLQIVLFVWYGDTLQLLLETQTSIIVTWVTLTTSGSSADLWSGPYERALLSWMLHLIHGSLWGLRLIILIINPKPLCLPFSIRDRQCHKAITTIPNKFHHPSCVTSRKQSTHTTIFPAATNANASSAYPIDFPRSKISTSSDPIANKPRSGSRSYWMGWL